MSNNDCASLTDVWYRLPKKVTVPPKVCYTFPGQSEVCVIGNSYQINPPLIEGGQCAGLGYYAVAEIPCISVYQGVPPNTFYVSPQSLPGPIRSVTNWKKESEGRTVIVTYGAFVSTVNWNIIGTTAGNSSTYLWQYDYDRKTPSFIEVRRSDGTSKAQDIAQCGTGNTTLNIFLDGVTVSTVSGQGNPSVTTIAGSDFCTTEHSQFSYGSKIKGYKIEELNYINGNGNYCKKVIHTRNSTDTQKIVDLDVCSPSDCLVFPEVKYTGNAKKCQPKKPDCENAVSSLGAILSNQLCTTECNSDIFYVHVLQKNAAREIVYPIYVKDVRGFKGFAQCVSVKATKEGWKITIQTASASPKLSQAIDVISVNECPITSKFRVTCGANKPKKIEKEGCPPNTCYECIDGDYKCCYDQDLKLIKTIKK